MIAVPFSVPLSGLIVAEILYNYFESSASLEIIPDPYWFEACSVAVLHRPECVQSRQDEVYQALEEFGIELNEFWADDVISGFGSKLLTLLAQFFPSLLRHSWGGQELGVQDHQWGMASERTRFRTACAACAALTGGALFASGFEGPHWHHRATRINLRLAFASWKTCWSRHNMGIEPCQNMPTSKEMDGQGVGTSASAIFMALLVPDLEGSTREWSNTLEQQPWRKRYPKVIEA